MTDTLVLIDFVNDLVTPGGKLEKLGTAAHAASRDVITKAATALAHARATDKRVVHVRVGFAPGHPELQALHAPFYKAHIANDWLVKDTWGTEFATVLTPLESEVVIPKERVNPFTNPAFAETLDIAGVVTIAGVSTNLAVEEAIRTGAALGYQLQVIEDACASNNQDRHDFAFVNTFPLFASVITTKDFLDQ